LQIARDREDWVGGLRLAKDAYDKAPKKTALLRASYAEFLLRSSSAADEAEGTKILDTLAAEDKTGTLATADAWQRLDKYGRAAAAARAGLERDKEDPDLLFRLAASLEREKKVAESVDAFEKLLKVRGDHAPGLNKLDKAEENLRAASVLNPDDATVEEHLGDLFEKKGDLPLARTSWKRALTLKPDEDVKRRLDEKLQKTEGRDARKLRRAARGTPICCGLPEGLSPRWFSP